MNHTAHCAFHTHHTLYIYEDSKVSPVWMGSANISTDDYLISKSSGLEVIKLEFILRLKIKCNDWLLADTCPQAANHCALF